MSINPSIDRSKWAGSATESRFDNQSIENEPGSAWAHKYAGAHTVGVLATPWAHNSKNGSFQIASIASKYYQTNPFPLILTLPSPDHDFFLKKVDQLQGQWGSKNKHFGCLPFGWKSSSRHKQALLKVNDGQ